MRLFLTLLIAFLGTLEPCLKIFSGWIVEPDLYKSVSLSERVRVVDLDPNSPIKVAPIDSLYLFPRHRHDRLIASVDGLDAFHIWPNQDSEIGIWIQMLYKRLQRNAFLGILRKVHAVADPYAARWGLSGVFVAYFDPRIAPRDEGTANLKVLNVYVCALRDLQSVIRDLGLSAYGLPLKSSEERIEGSDYKQVLLDADRRRSPSFIMGTGLLCVSFGLSLYGAECFENSDVFRLKNRQWYFGLLLLGLGGIGFFCGSCLMLFASRF